MSFKGYIVIQEGCEECEQDSEIIGTFDTLDDCLIVRSDIFRKEGVHRFIRIFEGAYTDWSEVAPQREIPDGLIDALVDGFIKFMAGPNWRR